MKDSELQFDRTCHVLYSKPCKRQIREKIALHYPEGECETVWERVQRQYVTFLRDWRTDLGGSKNFHNGKGGTYDCIALMSYYVVCPTAEFARQFGLLEVMPALCAPTTPPWSCSARGSCAARRAQTAAAATIRSAATGTRCVRSTPNTATRRGIGAIRPDGGSVVGLACPASGGGTFPAREKYPKACQNKGFWRRSLVTFFRW